MIPAPRRYYTPPAYPDGSEGELMSSSQLGSPYVHIQSIQHVEETITALKFDPYYELLWASTSMGHVTSYWSTSMNLYTSFDVLYDHSPVKELILFDNALCAIGRNEVKTYRKEGLCKSTIRSASFQDLSSGVKTDYSRVLVCGKQPQLLEVDIQTERVIKQVPCEESFRLRLLPQRYVLAGVLEGKISLLDADSLKAVHCFDSGFFALHDFDVRGNYVVACGRTKTMNQRSSSFLKVFDLRQMREVMPIQQHFGATLLRFFPVMTSRLLVASADGVIEIVDVSDGGALPEYVTLQSSLKPNLCAVDIAASSLGLAVAEQTGVVHLLGRDGKELFFNQEPRDPEVQPSVLSRPVCAIEAIERPNGFLSQVSLSLPTETLASSLWPCTGGLRPIVRQYAPIEDSLLASVAAQSGVPYVPNTAGRLRNLCPYLDKGSKRKPSQKQKSADDTPAVIPPQYRRVEVSVRKLEAELYEWRAHNCSCFSGLENHLVNAYCNSLIQVLFFVAPLRAALKAHHCLQNGCFSCELRFVFGNLETARGRPCHTANLQRAMRIDRNATAFNVAISEAAPNVSLPEKLQNLTRFLLQQMATELRADDHSPVDAVLACSVETCSTCRAGHVVNKTGELYCIRLDYPKMEPESVRLVSFGELLQNSLCLQSSASAWCDSCESYQTQSHVRSVRALAPFLFIDCNADMAKQILFWKHHHKRLRRASLSKSTRRMRGSSSGDEDNAVAPLSPVSPASTALKTPLRCWLPERITIFLLADGSVHSVEPEQEQPIFESSLVASLDYQLKAVIVHAHHPDAQPDELGRLVQVKDTKQMPRNGLLVCHVRVPPDELKKAGHSAEDDQWFLFNDFLVQPLDKMAAIDLDLDWMLPCLVLYEHVDAACPVPVPPPLPFSLIQQKPLIFRGSALPFEPLAEDEVLQLAGIDTEFVLISPEKVEATGSRVIRPAQWALARLSCVRGDGDKQDVPFIDEYIAQEEPIADCLTAVSGISKSDLEVAHSKHYLVTAKSALLKLLWLVERGVKFVGHGLAKDFRVINMMVPPDQVIDTSKLFHLEKRRVVSLQFLVWFYLEERIQESCHDSVDDARAALKLFRWYDAHKQEHGVHSLEQQLERMYEKGEELQWTLPAL